VSSDRAISRIHEGSNCGFNSNRASRYAHQRQQGPLVKQQQTEKMKGKAQDKIEGAESSGEKLKEKAKEPIRRKL
jgi:hypothetical protein